MVNISPFLQSQDHQEHGVSEHGADSRGVEKEVREGERKEQRTETRHSAPGE